MDLKRGNFSVAVFGSKLGRPAEALNSFMRKFIAQILRSHNLSLQNDFSIEIQAQEGACSFSRPLVIYKKGPLVILAHYTVSTYDTDYDPLVELDAETFAVISWYRFHSGLRVVSKDLDETVASSMLDEWKQQLEQSGYLDSSQTCIVTSKL